MIKPIDLHIGCYYKATEDFPMEVTSETWFKKDRIILMTERMLKVFLIAKSKDQRPLYEFIEGVELTDDWWDKFNYECIQEFVTCLVEDSKFPIIDDVGYWVSILKDMPVHEIQIQYFIFTGKELNDIR